uniref:Putative DNA binding, helix-turn-helix domain containing protein n=1 Tax=viral metagenome TaxID=1070528 RepID=A0A6H2A4F3_9ZZZZ
MEADKQIEIKRNEKVREYRKKGWSYSKISRMFHISRQRVHQICRVK